MSSDLDVQNLTTAVHPVFRVHAVGAESAAICRILGEFRRAEGVGGATVGAAAFGLFAFRIGHGRKWFAVMAAPRKRSRPSDVKVRGKVRRFRASSDSLGDQEVRRIRSVSPCEEARFSSRLAGGDLKSGSRKSAPRPSPPRGRACAGASSNPRTRDDPMGRSQVARVQAVQSRAGRSMPDAFPLLPVPWSAIVCRAEIGKRCEASFISCC